MKHREIKYSLPDFVNNKLAGNEQQSVSEHLLACLDCKREGEELQSLMLELNKETVTAPSPQYWSSLLPRIHERIERKSERQLPEWLVRFVLPLSAAAGMLLFIVNFKSSDNATDLRELQTMIQQLPSEELHRVTETVTSPGFSEAYDEQKDEISSLAEDSDIFKSLVRDDTDIATHTDINIEAATEKLSAGDTDDFIAALERTVPE